MASTVESKCQTRLSLSQYIYILCTFFLLLTSSKGPSTFCCRGCPPTAGWAGFSFLFGWFFLGGPVRLDRGRPQRGVIIESKGGQPRRYNTARLL